MRIACGETRCSGRHEKKEDQRRGDLTVLEWVIACALWHSLGQETELK
jgi:hypothetical protein